MTQHVKHTLDTAGARVLIFLLISFVIEGLASQSLFAQARQFFPTISNFRWDYSYKLIDTLGTVQDLPSSVRSNSLWTGSTPFEGRTAERLITQSAFQELSDSIFLPTPNDTAFLSFNGDTAFSFINPLQLLGAVGDSAQQAEIDAFAGFLNNFRGWFSLYRFNAALNTNYTVVSRDTAITLDATSISLRFLISGRRLTNQSVTTPVGTFNSSRFVITYTVGIPVFTVVAPIVQIRDTVAFAQNQWMVQSTIPNSRIPAGSLPVVIEGLPNVSLPGRIMTLDEPPPLRTIREEREKGLSKGFVLDQNYPNPFNPTTTIPFTLSAMSTVKLEVFSLLGQRVAILSEGRLPAGLHRVRFDASGLASGVYLYRLSVQSSQNGLSTFRKMVLLK